MPETGPKLVPNPESSPVKEEGILSQEKVVGQDVTSGTKEQKDGFTNAEELVNDFFEETNIRGYSSSRDNWQWSYDIKNNVINMQAGSGADAYVKPIKVDSLKVEELIDQENGINNILKLVKGKNGRFISYEGNLYLELSGDSMPVENVNNSEAQIETLYGVAVDRDPKKLEGTGFKLDQSYTKVGGKFYKFLGVDPKNPDDLLYIIDSGFGASVRSGSRDEFEDLIEKNSNLEVLEANGYKYLLDTSPDSFEENGLECRRGSKVYNFKGEEVIIAGLSADGFVVAVDSQDRIFTFDKNCPIPLSKEEVGLTPYDVNVYIGPQIEKKYGLKLKQKFFKENNVFVFQGLDSDGDCVLEMSDGTVEYVNPINIFLQYSPVVENEEFLKHFEAKKAKADRFKESVQFQALMKLIKSDPDLNEEYQVVVKRRDEFKNIQKSGRYSAEDKIQDKDNVAGKKLLEDRLKAIKNNERHRDYTAMLSAIMLSPRLRALMELMLDHSTEEYSKQIKTRMERGEENYVEEIVVGTGVYSTILATTRQMYFPENPSLSIEALRHTGGQFAEYGGDAFQLNSRTRPEQRDKPYLPGTEQALNTFEEHAVLQPADIESLTYSPQSSVSDPARMNFFLAGRAITDAKLEKIRKNNEGGLGKYILEVFDKETGKMLTIKTDRVIFSSGLGVETANLDRNDTRTQTILREEKSAFEEGKDAKVMSFKELSIRLADNTNPFPIRGMKTVAVSGSGDSSLVAMGLMLGYERRLSKTPMQIDRVEKIYWLGAKCPTKEEFVQNVRTRYARVGLDLPRKDIEDYYSRIVPVQEVKANRLSRSGDKILVEDSSGNVYEVDHYIYAHGFEDEKNSIVSGVSALIYQADRFESLRLNDPFRFYGKGSQFFYEKEAPYKSIEVAESNSVRGQYFLKLKLIDQENNVSFVRVSNQDKEADQYLNSKKLKRIEIATDLLKSEDEVRSQKDRTIAIAKNYTGEEIYTVGVAAKITPTQKEKERSEAVKRIPENSASIFLSASKVKEFAEIKAMEDIRNKKEIRSKALRFEVEKDVVLEPLKENNTRIGDKKIILELDKVSKLPLEGNSLDILRFAVAESLEKYKFPANISELNLLVSRADISKSETDIDNPKSELTFSVFEKIRQKGYEKMIVELIDNDLVQAVCEKITRLNSNRTQNVEIRIPIYKGSVLPGSISYRINV